MPDSPSDISAWLAEELALQVAGVFETMTGERPSTSQAALPPPSRDEGLLWRQPFSTFTGAVWIYAAEPSWNAAAKLIVSAAGMSDTGPPLLKSTFLEASGQALSGLAQAISKRVNREVTPVDGREDAPADQSAAWAAITLKFASIEFTIHAAFEATLVRELSAAIKDNAHPERSTPFPEPAAAHLERSKTFELLLDVELPVSVSFGRAQVPLKDVLKLTTGSIIELNRSIVEPVEIIVNNCVIARGEVVVVEGNFGVRIQEVVSRQERLRTLH